MSEEKSLEEMSLRELEAMQVAKEHENREAIRLMAEVEIADNDLARRVAELQLERRKVKDGMIKAERNMRSVSSVLRVIKSLIYKKLRGE